MTRFSRQMCKAVLAISVLSFAPLAWAQGAKIQALTPQTLDPAIKAGKWLIVEFGGQTCIPCMQMQPVLLEVQKKLSDKGRVHNFWIQEYPDTARRFGIMVMPTQIIFDAKGKEILRHQGYWDLEAFQQTLKTKGIL